MLAQRIYWVAPLATATVLAALATMLVLLKSAGAAPADTIADRVYGQGGSFTSGTCNLSGVSASSLCITTDVVVDPAGRLYVADYGNNRVLEYDSPLTSSVADRVFGQGGSFTSNTCNLGGISASSLCRPQGLAVDTSGRLYVADWANNRVLVYDSPLTSQVADRVFGQGGSFTSASANLGGISASSLKEPTDVELDALGRLYVTDYLNNRVLEYDSPLASQVADRVFGQGGSFSTNICNNGGTTANSLCRPIGVASDTAGRLYIADYNNNRVLEYDNPLTSQVADRVFGQGGSFTSAIANLGGISASSLNRPTVVAVDSVGHLYVGDYNNNRVLEYDNPLTSQVADRVFGQGGNFTTNGCTPISASSLCTPYGLAVDALGDLYIAASTDNRVLEYDSPLGTPSPTPCATGCPVGGVVDVLSSGGHAPRSQQGSGPPALPIALAGALIAVGLALGGIYGRRRVRR